MRFVDNGVPEDFARLTFDGLTVPLCRLSEEEYMWVVHGVTDYISKVGTNARSTIINVQVIKPSYFDDSIDVLELSVRAEHCLQRANIKTVGQLCGMTEFELSQIRNLGAKSVREIKEKLKVIGGKLHDSNVDS